MKTTKAIFLHLVVLTSFGLTPANSQAVPQKPPIHIITADQLLMKNGCDHFLGRQGEYLCTTEQSYQSCMSYLKQNATVKFCILAGHPETGTRNGTPGEVETKLRSNGCKLVGKGAGGEVWSCPSKVGLTYCQNYMRGKGVLSCIDSEPPTVTAQTPTRVPLYRLLDPNTFLHFYTSNPVEKDAVVRDLGMRFENITGWVYPPDKDEVPGTTPLYRVYLPDTGAHFYTTDNKEADTAAANGGTREGIACYVSKSQQSGTAPLYQLYKPYVPAEHHQVTVFSIDVAAGVGGDDHFYTANEAERYDAEFKFGYKFYGNMGYVWTTAK